MATKLPHKMLTYNRQGEIDFASLEFDPYEPEPLPEGMIQNPYLFDFIPILVAHYEGRRDVFLDSNTFICYDRRNLNVRVGPDFYIATGVDARAIRERALYLPWEAGKPPDLALEVASASTARHDVGRKRASTSKSACRNIGGTTPPAVSYTAVRWSGSDWWRANTSPLN